MEIDWSFVLSVITVVIAVVAIIQTLVQIKLSNKQALFDRRLNNYIIIKNFIDVYDSAKTFLDKDIQEDAFHINELYFLALTNMSMLEDVQTVIKDTSIIEHKNNLLRKLEKIESVSLECEMIFAEKYSTYLCAFINSYKDALMNTYTYQILLEHIEKDTKQIWFKDIDDSRERLKEKEAVEKLSKVIQKLKMDRLKLKEIDVEKNIKKQIKM